MPSQRISMAGSVAGETTHTTTSGSSSGRSRSRSRNHNNNINEKNDIRSINKSNVRGKPKRPKAVQRQSSDYDIDYEIDAGIQAKMDAAEEESSAPYNVSLVVIALWVVISALYIYESVMLTNSIRPYFNGDDECCGYSIELGVIPTIFYFVTMVTYLLAIIFMVLASALVKQRECYLPLIHICFTLSPLFEALMFWLLLYTASEHDGKIAIILESVRIVLQLVAMSLAMQNKQGCCKGMICHIIIQCLALAAIIVVYVLYLNNGGVCYVVEREATYFGGCEVCPFTGYPPNAIDGSCLMKDSNSSSSSIFDEDKLETGSFCSVDNVGVTEFDQNFCFFPSSSL